MPYHPIIPRECRANCTASFQEFTMSEMFSCRYFRSYRVDVHKEAELRCDGHSFQHILCVDGNGVISANGVMYPLCRGDSYFLPAAMGEYRIAGACRVLLSRI